MCHFPPEDFGDIPLRISAAVAVDRVKILLDHHCDLEHDGVIKLAQIKAGELLDLLQPVHKRVAVNIQLAARFRDVEVILEEFVYRFKRVLVKSFKRIFLEHLVEEHFAERGGQLIYYTADAEIFIADDRLFRIEYSADIDRDLGFLIAVGKLAQVARGRSDADDAFYLKLVAQNGLDAFGNGFHLGALL